MNPLVSAPYIKWNDLDVRNLTDCKGVHVFKALVSDDVNYSHLYADVLSTDEEKKALRFKREADCRSYRLRKYVLRQLLSVFTGVNASAITYRYGEHKKPAVEGIAFNSSHSGNCILIAIAPAGVGIDVEHIRHDFDFDVLMDTCFTAEEQAFINQGERRNNFFSLWTRKEAVLKANGTGLITRLNELNCLDMEVTFKGQHYILTTQNVDEQYTMSLATNAAEMQINYWNY